MLGYDDLLACCPVATAGMASLAIVISWLWALLARSLPCPYCSSLLLLCLCPSSAFYKLGGLLRLRCLYPAVILPLPSSCLASSLLLSCPLPSPRPCPASCRPSVFILRVHRLSPFSAPASVLGPLALPQRFSNDFVLLRLVSNLSCQVDCSHNVRLIRFLLSVSLLCLCRLLLLSICCLPLHVCLVSSLVLAFSNESVLARSRCGLAQGRQARQAGDMPHACQAYQASRPGKVCKPSKPSRQARQGRQGRQGRQARQGTSSGNAAIANFKIGRLSVCDMYIFSTGSQHVYPFFGHTNTLAATIGGNAATANFKIGRLSICDVYLLHRIAKCISFLLPYSYIGWHKQCQRSYLQFQNWTSFGLRPVCLLNRIAKRISFLGPHQPYGPRLLGSR